MTRRVLGGDGMPALLPLGLFLELVALGATFPVIAYYVEQLGGDASHTTFTFFLMAAPKLFTQPLWGRLSDRIGRKPVLALGFLGSFASYLIWALAVPLFGLPAADEGRAVGAALACLLVSRLVHGLFGSQLTVASSMVADCLQPADRARAMGVLGATAGVGFVVGPILGGWVGETLSYAAVGWMNAGLELAAVLLTLLALPETLAVERRGLGGGAGQLQVWRLALRHPQVGRLLWVVLLATLGISVLQGTSAHLAADRWAYDARHFGHVLGFLGIIGILVQGGALRPLVPRFGEVRLALAGALLAAVGLVALVLPGGPWLLWTGIGVSGLGVALFTPTSTALLSRATAVDAQGAVLGLNQGVTGLGRAASGLTMGWLYREAGASTPFLLSAGLLVLAGLVLARRGAATAPPLHLAGPDGAPGRPGEAADGSS